MRSQISFEGKQTSIQHVFITNIGNFAIIVLNIKKKILHMFKAPQRNRTAVDLPTGAVSKLFN